MENEQNMNFVAIDFETATSQRCSPCEIGLTFVKNNKIENTLSWLIKPVNNEYDGFNTYIHGIKPEDTAKSPEFNEIWEDIKPHIEGKYIIAHNASFDISVLRQTLELYEIPFPSFSYLCSYLFSKKVWPGLFSYRLNEICSINNINLQHHHRAGNDSRATAELSLKAFNTVESSSIEDFIEKINILPGKVYANGYEPFHNLTVFTKTPLPAQGSITTSPSKDQIKIKYNPDSIFCEKIVVFTGTLMSMTRKNAQQAILDIGGYIGKTITEKTDYMIV